MSDHNVPDNTESSKPVDTGTKTQVKPRVKQLVEEYVWAKHQAEKPKPKAIHVDEIASKVAVLYEKVRKIIDWKEEHLLRRAATERILKRKLISEISNFDLLPNTDPEKMAEPLVNELIRGGHFKNNSIPRQRVELVANSLKKYIYFLENNSISSSSKVKKKINFYNWIIEIAACEIEDILDPAWKENFLINYMTNSMDKKIQLSDEIQLSEQKQFEQIYIACHRTLFNLDDSLISYHLLKATYPQWLENQPEFYQEISNKITDIWESLGESLDHKYGNKFRNVCEKYDTAYLILGDILGEQEETEKTIEKLSQPSILAKLVSQAYDKRLSTLKGRLVRAAVYSTLSILVASIVSLFIAEVPLAKLVYGEFRPLAIIVDLLLPALVMFLLVLIIRLPSEENKERVIEEVKKLVLADEEEDVYELREHKRSLIARVAITSLYIVTTIASTTLVFYLFYVAKVPATSIFVDTLNVSMVVFAGLLIRQRAKELTIEEKATFWEFLLDILSVPVAKFGQWLSNKWREYNIVSVFLTVLVDMPFSSIIKFIEDWNSFVKERKAELH